ncbi:MAG: tail fiber domain-containing protein [Patescibacteria group bacterium]
MGYTSSYPFTAQGWGNFNLLVNGTTNKNGVGIDATGGGASAVPLVLRTPSTTLESFYYNTTGVGNITTNGSSTSYNTTSDYRLKENVVDLTGALDRISKLGVHRFDYKTNPERTVDGFLAHELQTVVPEAVTGTKDAVDENGKPVYQQVDYSKVVPLLSAGIKELKAEVDLRNAEMAEQKAEIEALKAEISRLENAK